MSHTVMAEYEQLKAITTSVLEQAGLRMVAEQLHPDVFGSAYCEYKGKGLNYRVVWDGREGRGYVQKRLNRAGKTYPLRYPIQNILHFHPS